MTADLLPVTAPRNVTRGDAVLAGLIFGRATQTRTAGQQVLLRRRGVFTFPKVAGFATTAWATALHFSDGDAGLSNDPSKPFVCVAAESVAAEATSVRAVIFQTGPLLISSGRTVVPRFELETESISDVAAKTAFGAVDLTTLVAGEQVRNCVVKIDAVVDGTDSGQVVICLAAAGTPLLTEGGDYHAGVAQLATIDVTASGSFDLELDLDVVAAGVSAIVDARFTLTGDTPPMSERRIVRGFSGDLSAGLRVGAVFVPSAWGPSSIVSLAMVGERRIAAS